MSGQVEERPGQSAYQEIQEASRSSNDLSRWSGKWRCLAGGSTGMVFVVFDRILGKQVAVKKVAQQIPGIPIPCLTEMQTLRMVDHPHIVDIYSVIHSGRFVYMSFEYCEFGDLSNLLSSISNQNTVRRLCYEIACGVECLHRNGILHRDLKPQNILITRYGGVRIGDCGIAALLCSPGPKDLHHETGTMPYRSPEQNAGTTDYSFPSDIWSLAVLFCQLALAGRNIFYSECYNMFVQLAVIRRSLGNPTEESWPSLRKYQVQLARSSFWKVMNSLPPYSRLSFKRFFHMDPRLANLIDSIFQWEPSKRPPIEEILTADYFAGIDEYCARREETVQEFDTMYGQTESIEEFNQNLALFLKYRRNIGKPVDRFFDEIMPPDVSGYHSFHPIFDEPSFVEQVKNLPAEKKLEYRDRFGPTWISHYAQMKKLEMMVQLGAVMINLLQWIKKSIGEPRSAGLQYMLLEKKWLVHQLQLLAITDELKQRIRDLRGGLEVWRNFELSLLALGVRMKFWSTPPCDANPDEEFPIVRTEERKKCREFVAGL